MSGVQYNERYPEAESVAETVLINPVITAMGSAIEEDWEGCLSVPGMRGLVPRFAHIRYQGQDEYGSLIDRTVSGFHARVVQHECDHLDGILYPMRIEDLKQFQIENKTIRNYPKAKFIKHSNTLMEYECDILVPAALENQITKENAPRIKAKIIGEGANGPMTPEGEKILVTKGPLIVADLYLNAVG